MIADLRLIRFALRRLNYQTLIWYALWVLFIGYIAFILLYNLLQWPPPWYDEATVLRVSKNFAFNGVYADYSSDGNRYTGPLMSVGPTVLLPIAMGYKLFGVSIELARLVMVFYSVLTLLAVYGLGIVLFNKRFAFLAVVLFVAIPPIEQFIRTVLGEIPSLFFLFAGLWLWMRDERPNWVVLMGSGVLLGLGSITKTQMGVCILAALVAATLLNFIWFRSRRWVYFVVPTVVAGIILAGWMYYTANILGTGDRNFAADADLIRKTTAVALAPSFEVIRINVTKLLEWNVLFVPALVLGLIFLFRRDKEGQQWTTLYLLVLASTGFFVASNGSFRYLYPAQALIVVFIAYILYQLLIAFPVNWQGLRAIWRGKTLSASTLLSFMVLALIVGMLVLPVYRKTSNVIFDADSYAYKVVDYLKANFPPRTLIETTEAQISLLTDHIYHEPPDSFRVERMMEDHLGIKRIKLYDFREWVDPDLVIVGPTAGVRETYPDKHLADYPLIKQFGPYRIYAKQIKTG